MGKYGGFLSNDVLNSKHFLLSFCSLNPKIILLIETTIEIISFQMKNNDFFVIFKDKNSKAPL